MKNFLVGLLTVLCVGFALGSILYVTDIFDPTQIFNKTEEGTASFYVRFMDDFFIVDENGIVLRSSLNEPTDIPEIRDMYFSSLAAGEAAQAADEDTLEYIKEVCTLLLKYDIYISYICVSDDELTLYLNNDLSVMLGENEDTDTKIKDLDSLYSVLIDYTGVLYMQDADTSGFGYTFKVSDGA